MTGWRIGYFAAPKDIASAVARLQSHTSNPTSIAQYAAIEALTMDQSILNDMFKIFDSRRLYMIQRLSDIPGIQMNQSRGCIYAFPKIDALFGKTTRNGKQITNSLTFCEVLLEEANVACVRALGLVLKDICDYLMQHLMKILSKDLID